MDKITLELTSEEVDILFENASIGCSVNGMDLTGEKRDEWRRKTEIYADIERRAIQAQVKLTA
jgi:hypothetical protein